MTSRSIPGAPSAPRPRPRGVRLGATVLACALAVTPSLTMPAAHADDVPQPSAHYDMSHRGDTLLDVSGSGHDARITGAQETSFVAARSPSSDLDAIELPGRTSENLPLVAEGTVEGAQIVWESSDPAVITPTDPDHAAPEVGMDDPFAGAGVLTRPAYGQGDAEVTLTATASLGERTETREYAVTVAEMPRTAPDAGYAAAYFRSDDDERIYAAATTENDVFTFEEVNGGAPI